MGNRDSQFRHACSVPQIVEWWQNGMLNASCMEQRKTFFVSGVAGFLGSHLADVLIAQGYRVVGVDSLVGGYLDNVNSKVEFYELDLIDREKLVPLLKDVDVVYHCAAAPYDAFSVFSPHFVSRNVYDITVSLLSAAVANKVRRFVYCSSMARYGAQETVPFTEDMIPHPQDPYGIAKYAAELQVRNIAATHGMEYVIAIPHNIIGPRQKYDDPYRNVTSIMINLMLQKRQPFIYGDGEQMRCFSFIGDVIEPLLRLADSPRVVGEVINVGPDEEPVTLNTFAHKIAELLEFEIKPVYLPERPQEVRLATCKADKARELLGYKTSTSLQEGLKSMINYIKERGPKPFTYAFQLEIENELTPRTWKDKLL
jgi:UDP-glucose 4-epimerase